VKLINYSIFYFFILLVGEIDLLWL